MSEQQKLAIADKMESVGARTLFGRTGTHLSGDDEHTTNHAPSLGGCKEGHLL